MAQTAPTPARPDEDVPGGVLLATKLYVPPARPRGNVISRPRLMEQLDQGLAGWLQPQGQVCATAA